MEGVVRCGRRGRAVRLAARRFVFGAAGEWARFRRSKAGRLGKRRDRGGHGVLGAENAGWRQAVTTAAFRGRGEEGRASGYASRP